MRKEDVAVSLDNSDWYMHKMNSLNGTINEDKIIRTPPLDYTPDPRGLGYVFFTQMQKHGDNIAQIDGQTGERDAYSTLLQRCIRTAMTMRSKGVKPGDVITLCSFNHLNSCVPFISTFFVGAKLASVDPTLSLSDTAYLLKKVTPKLIFVIPEAVEMIETAVAETSRDTEIVVFGHTTKHTPFSDFLQPKQEEDNFKPFETKSLQETAIIFFSSGTSGLPKGICIGHFAYLSQIVNTIDFGYCLDVILSFASFYWVTTGLLWGMAIVEGTTRLILPKFDASVVWEKIDKYKPTFMFLAPSQILAMYNEGRPKGISTSSLKDLIAGGGPMSEDQILKVRKILPGTRVSLGYGQTEVVGFLTAFKPCNREEVDFICKKPTASGTGVRGLSYKIVDPETEEILGPNQQGELRVKTDFQLNGYYNQDSSDAWDSEGWLKTGDVVYYDEDRCFYVVDRIKEMLKFQSWHVPPGVIENVLLTHPSIKIAVVIGIPHELDGDHPMAIVVLKDPASSKDVTTEDIVKYVEERVHDRQRLRGGVRIVDRLPTTPTEKFKRREVKNMVLLKKM